MKSIAASLLASAALLTTATADSASTWLQWSSSSTPAPAAPAPVTWTDWVTSIETVYKTVDNYITVTETPKPVTVTATITSVPPPATVTVTAISVSGSVATVVNTVAVTKTDVSVSVSGSVATVVNTVTNVAPPATVYITSVGTVVNTVTVTDTVTITNVISSVSTTTTSVPLSGIVTCPTRTINPTYTVSTPFPSGYLWGCPVGTLCKPPRVNCNFEQNPPADTYYCSPDECEPIKPLPDLDVLLNVQVNATCAFYTPIDDYFNLNPQLFQMDYNIFNIYGNPVCPIIEQVYITVTTTVVSGTTVAVTVPSTIVQYSNVPTTVVNTIVNTVLSNVPVPTTLVQVSNVPVPTTVVNNVPVPTTVYSNVPVPTTVIEYVPTTVVEYETVSSSWGAWSSKVTKRAQLENRLLQKRADAEYASACFPACNAAVQIYQSQHTVPALCASNGQFSRAYDSFRACTTLHPLAGGAAGVQDVSLGVPVAYCSYPALKREAAPEPSAPAFRFARG